MTKTLSMLLLKSTKTGLLVSFCLLYFAFAAKAQMQIEYFYDRNDPGVGNATTLPTTFNTDSEISIELDVASLPLGFHTLHVRTKNDLERWSFAEVFPFELKSRNQVVLLSDAEYFFDDDPGYGLGQTFGAQGASAVFDIEEKVDATALARGFHNLFVRGLAEDGAWGIPEVHLVYIDQSGQTNIVDTVEYYFDIDPGFGLGDILTTSGGAIVDIEEKVSTDGLEMGFHNLFLRPKLEGGEWGLPQSAVFYVDPSGQSANIDTVEYFLNEDPGYGLGTLIPITSGIGVSVDIDEKIDAQGITPGFHNLFIRPKLEGGNWGIFESSLIYVDPSGQVTNIDTVEYFVDVDPGYGNGAIIPLTSGVAPQVDIDEKLVTSGLERGFHNVFIRAKLEGGTWGMPETSLIYVDESGVTDSIDAVEYFIDEDPGVGNATPIDFISSAPIVNVDQNIDGQSITTGFHNVFFRARKAGGTWGIYESHLVYVDLSAGSPEIEEVEYFIDNDPGYGAGTGFDAFEANNIVFIEQLLEETDLPKGFHTLYVRSKLVGGTWSMPESRAFLIDEKGVELFPVKSIEYFVSEDPGYGNGIEIDLGETNDTTFQFIIPDEMTDSGQLTVGVRALNTNDQWSIPETQSFFNLPPGRALDSLALTRLFEATNGNFWFLRFGWNFSVLDSWSGVGLTNGRVDSLSLPNNNISGAIPREFTFLDQLRYLNLGSNLIQDTIPDGFAELQALETIDLSSNAIRGLPPLGALPALDTFSVEDNFLDFGDLEPNVGLSGFNYQNQRLFGDIAVDSVIPYGRPFALTHLNFGGDNNVFQWTLNDNPIPSQTESSITIPFYTGNDTGRYQLTVTSPIVTDLVLTSRVYNTALPYLDQDSLALVSLYQSLDGDRWLNADNWLSGPLSSWVGVTLDSVSNSIFRLPIDDGIIDGDITQDLSFRETDEVSEFSDLNILNQSGIFDDFFGNVKTLRLVGLQLDENGLSGTIPDDFAYANALQEIDLSRNEIMDSLPASLLQLDQLHTLRLDSNDLVYLPDFGKLDSLDTVSIAGNRLQFDVLERLFDIADYTYAPQQIFGSPLDTLMETDSSITFTADARGNLLTYEWFKDDVSLSDSSGLLLENVTFNDEGDYRVEVSSLILPDLTLVSANKSLRVSSLERDKLVLLELFNATNGENWTLNTNWSEENDLTSEWTGVAIGNNRVTGLNLSNNALSGQVPQSITDITSLQTANFSNNDLTDIANFEDHKSLTSLDVSENFLQFDALEKNVNTAGIVYSPQKNFGAMQDLTLKAGASLTLDGQIAGSANQYEWTLDGVSIGAMDSVFFVDSLKRSDIGAYQVNITSNLVDGLTISSNLSDVQVVSDISGILYRTDGTTTLDAGNATLYKVQDGPFDSLTTVEVSDGGAYTFSDVLLDDYMVLARTEETGTELLQTYFGNTHLWEDADTIELRQNSDGQNLDIDLVGEPVNQPKVGDNGILGIVETNFDDETTSSLRIQARRRVRLAGVSLYRPSSELRTQSVFDTLQFIAYTTTNDDGQFSFDNLSADDIYYINIQFPGVPMDSNSVIPLEFDLARDKNQIQLEAEITEEGIQLTEVTRTGVLKPFVRDLNVYPVPTNDLLNINYKVNRKLNGLKMKIFNNLGVCVFATSLDHKLGLQGTSVDLSGLADGLYHLTIADEDGNIKLTYKVTKQ